MTSARKAVLEILSERKDHKIDLTTLAKELYRQRVLGFGVEPEHVAQALIQVGKVVFDRETKMVYLVHQQHSKEQPVPIICLYADDRTSETLEIVEYLMKEKISFSTIPTSGCVSYIVFGVAKYTGWEGAKKLVERLKEEEFYKNVKYLPELTDEELAGCLATMLKNAKKNK